MADSTPFDTTGLRADLDAGLAEMGLGVDSARCDQLIDYLSLLSRWNKTHNLTAVRDPQQMVTRHLLDSLSVSSFVESDRLLDVGAGAGLPGLPLAITHPALQVTLVDSVKKKTQFMAFVASALKLDNVTVEHTRIEDLSTRDKFPVVTARAFAEVSKLCELTAHLIATDGRVLAMIGRSPEHEQMESFGQISGFSFVGIEKLRVAGEQAQRNLVILKRSC